MQEREAVKAVLHSTAHDKQVVYRSVGMAAMPAYPAEAGDESGGLGDRNWVAPHGCLRLGCHW